MIVLKSFILLFTNFFFIRTFVRTFFEKFPEKHFQKNHPPLDVSDVLDGLLMHMKAGYSLENALAASGNDNVVLKKLFLAIENENHLREAVTYDQSLGHEMAKILGFCRKNPSQSYKILEFWRQSSRLRTKLHRKQEAITLQAKAQAIVCVILFAGLLAAQSLLNPEFPRYLESPFGKLTSVVSAVLVAFGVFKVFQMARPKELKI